jgi:hypothetical protein
VALHFAGIIDAFQNLNVAAFEQRSCGLHEHPAMCEEWEIEMQMRSRSNPAAHRPQLANGVSRLAALEVDGTGR